MNKNKGVTLNLSSGASIEFLDRKNVELTEELALAHETGTYWAELAKDRHNRILELSIESNKLKDEIEALRKDRDRLAYLIKHSAIVEESKNGQRFWLVFPNGETQAEIFDTPKAAIDGMIERERPWT